jgi:hypothetical protein
MLSTIACEDTPRKDSSANDFLLENAYSSPYF